jgi:hypothetical protein
MMARFTDIQANPNREPQVGANAMLTREQAADLKSLILSQAKQSEEGKPLHIRPEHYTRSTSRPIGGEYQTASCNRPGELGIIIVDGVGGLAGHSIGFIPEGHEAVQEYGAPAVPGPWAYAFANCSIMDEQGGTLGEVFRAFINDNRVYRTHIGGILDIEGVRFIVHRANNDNIRLVREPSEDA